MISSVVVYESSLTQLYAGGFIAAPVVVEVHKKKR